MRFSILLRLGCPVSLLEACCALCLLLTQRRQPATALTLRLYAEGHPDLRQSHPHHVEDWSQEPHQMLCYATNATLAIGAWEHYVPQQPQRNLIATWGGWITRGRKRDRGVTKVTAMSDTGDPHFRSGLRVLLIAGLMLGLVLVVVSLLVRYALGA